MLKFIKEGGGFVTSHASTSAFYEWPDIKEISTSTWLMDSTWHGKKSATHMMIENKQHPIIKEMSDFLIYDELWVNTGKNEKFEVLESATNEDISGKDYENQPAINSSEDELFEDIQHERRIELAFEDHRYFDSHKWIIADEVENEDVLGIKWYKKDDN
ncbi:MAG: RagB/SusD family nutrient uptake outer membrane protein, partial [Bacteroidota bacterium]